ncbi:hypothetical protein [Acinetobacter colistiniresistens]|uniref:hypothetical protein n=1 Tax=Acinetobacter colistiniresistens TaxID=280145 RepID=UPI002FE35230
MRSEFETLEQYQDSMKKFNENTRIGFENFIQSHGSERNKLQLRCTPYTDKKGGYGSFDLDFGLSVYQHQQSKVDELQRRNQMLNDNIKEQGQKLVYQNEVIETQAEKLLGLRDENAEMQKRVDAAQKLLEKWKTTGLNGTSDYAVGGAHARQNCEDELEQALKGVLDE